MIAQRFEVISELRKHSGTTVYRAHDTETGVTVALRESALGEARWGSAEEFETSVAGMLTLEHPAIPRFTAAFTEESEGEVHAYVAQEFIDGPTLGSLLDDGKTWTEEEAVRDATAVLEALGYLHQLDPAVVHGRIGVTKLVRRADGAVALLGLDDAKVAGDDGSCASDLFDLGWTLAHILTGATPSELRDDDDHLNIDELGEVSPAFVEILRRLTSPEPAARYEDATAVLGDLASLSRKTAPVPAPTAVPEPAPDTDTEPASSNVAETEETVPPIAATAPLEAPKPTLSTTAPLAAPKPVPQPVVQPAQPPPVTINAPAVAAEDDAEPLYFRRTKNFPKWCTVEPLAQGEFLIEFEMRDLEERRLEIAIVDKLEHLELRTFVNREKRESARKKRVMLVLAGGAIAAVVMFFVYAPIVPLVVIATIGGVAAVMLKNDDVEEGPAMELTITPHDLTLVRRDEFRLRASPRDARWFLERNTELCMATERQVPVLELSREARMQADWFHRYVDARCQEIGSRIRFHRVAEEPAGLSEVTDEPTAEVPVPVIPAPIVDESAEEMETAEHPIDRTSAAAPPPPVSNTQLLIGVSSEEHSEVEDVATEQVVLAHLSAPTEAAVDGVEGEETQQVVLEHLQPPSEDSQK